MSKIPIARAELTEKVLAAIRQHPGCQSLREIAITPVDVLDVGAAWHVNIIDSGDVEMALARPREAFKRALARCSKD